MKSIKKLQYIRKKLAHMRSAKRETEQIWKKIAELIVPEIIRGNSFKPLALEPRHFVNELVEALSVSVTSPTTEWFSFYNNGNPNKEVSKFCKDLEETFYRLLRRSKFYESLGTIYIRTTHYIRCFMCVGRERRRWKF